MSVFVLSSLVFVILFGWTLYSLLKASYERMNKLLCSFPQVTSFQKASIFYYLYCLNGYKGKFILSTVWCHIW